MTKRSTLNRYLVGSLLVIVLFIGLTSLAQAAPAPTDILDQVAQTFHTTVQTWGAKARSYAEHIFLGVAVIGLIWNCGWLALQREDIGAFFSTFIRWMLFVGFFWWLTEHAAEMATAIFSSFQKIGGDIGNVTGGTLGPSTPINTALQIDVATENAMSLVHPINSVVLALVDLAILVAMAAVAANMLVALCSAWVMAYAGSVLVGFGAVKWTSDIAINYFRTVLGVSVTYMTMVMLVGLSQQFFNLLLSEINNGTTTFQSLMVMAAVAIVLAFLVHKIPPLVGSITGNNGGAHGSLGIGAAIGAAAAVGAVMATGGASLAAASAASAAGATVGGGGSLGPMMAAVNAGGEGDGGGLGGGDALADTISAANDSGQGGEGASPLAAAMGGGGSSSGGGSSGGMRGPGAVGSFVGSSGWSGGSRVAAAATAVGTVAMAVAHAGVHAMDQAVGGSGYQGQLAPAGGRMATIAAARRARDAAAYPAQSPHAEADSTQPPHIEESDIPPDLASNDDEQSAT